MQTYDFAIYIYLTRIFNVNNIFMIVHIKIDDKLFTRSQNKDYHKRTVYRCITNNKRGIINMAVLIVSEQYVVVYRDPSLNIQMRQATSVGRYPGDERSCGA